MADARGTPRAQTYVDRRVQERVYAALELANEWQPARAADG